MARKEIPGKRLFILDTNVLMHDPTALFHFKEHDVYIPMVVLEELDSAKKGLSEVSRNVRQVSRFIDELMHDSSKKTIDNGILLNPPYHLSEAAIASTGKLFFQTHTMSALLPESLPGIKPDNHILGTAIALQEEHPDITVTIVSKDINLRIKATVLGIHAEDYYTDQVLDDVNLLFSGSTELDADFWDKHSKDMKSWKEEGHTYYEISGEQVSQWNPNQFLYMKDKSGFSARVCEIKKSDSTTSATKIDTIATIEVNRDYSQSSHPVWGINARNQEQNFALNLLMNPEIDFISLVGQAGTGKTLLTLAAAMEQTLEQGLYTEIIMTRVTVPVGEDIGFLPGTEEEKMTPWMGALMDNLEVLTKTENNGNGEWGKAVTNDLMQKRIKIRSMNFMRGRTFLNKFIILDEAQNLTAKQMKTLITRAGPGTKVICLGNIAQIDTPYLTETSSGLTYVVDRFKEWEHSGHITLLRGERSRLADYASEVL